MKSSKWKKTMAAALVSVMALSATACGGSQGEDKPGTQDSGSGNGAEAKEFVYVPEFQEMNGENISYYNMKYVGDSLYY
ncbi:MAG: hypothetical protein K2O97_14210, partial [Acetatifactor sp.]|nr:hypothetical protein [Acetatifactor sp.]